MAERGATKARSEVQEEKPALSCSSRIRKDWKGIWALSELPEEAYWGVRGAKKFEEPEPHTGNSHRKSLVS